MAYDDMFIMLYGQRTAQLNQQNANKISLCNNAADGTMFANRLQLDSTQRESGVPFYAYGVFVNASGLFFPKQISSDPTGVNGAIYYNTSGGSTTYTDSCGVTLSNTITNTEGYGMKVTALSNCTLSTVTKNASDGSTRVRIWKAGATEAHGVTLTTQPTISGFDGVLVHVKDSPVTLTKVTINADSPATAVQVRNATTHAVIDTATPTGGVATFSTALSANTDYEIGEYASGNHNFARNSSGTAFPYNKTYVNFTTSVYNDGTTTNTWVFGVNSIEVQPSTVLATGTFAGNDASVSLSLTTGTSYYVITDGSGASVAHKYANSVTYPISGTYVNWISGVSLPSTSFFLAPTQAFCPVSLTFTIGSGTGTFKGYNGTAWIDLGGSGGSSYWSRNSGLGLLYPTTTTDGVIVGQADAYLWLYRYDTSTVNIEAIGTSSNIGMYLNAKGTGTFHFNRDVIVTGGVSLTSTLTANSSTGTAGQVLTSNGASPAYWGSATSFFSQYTGGVGNRVQLNDSGYSLTPATSASTSENVGLVSKLWGTIYAMTGAFLISSLTYGAQIGNDGSGNGFVSAVGSNTNINLNVAARGTGSVIFSTSGSTSNLTSIYSTASSTTLGESGHRWATSYAVDSNITGTFSANGTVGSAGQVLTSNGSSAAYWATPSSGGGWNASGGSLWLNSGFTTLYLYASGSTGSDPSTVMVNSHFYPATTNSFNNGTSTYYWYQTYSNIVKTNTLYSISGSAISCGNDFNPISTGSMYLGSTSYKWYRIYVDSIGTSATRCGSGYFTNVYCASQTAGNHVTGSAFCELGLLPPDVKERICNGEDTQLPFTEGDVLVWKDGKLVKSYKECDSLVMAVAATDGRPIVMGADLIKVIGKVSEGDFLISAPDGCAVVCARGIAWRGCIIGQALEEKTTSEPKLIKAMIQKI